MLKILDKHGLDEAENEDEPGRINETQPIVLIAESYTNGSGESMSMASVPGTTCVGENPRNHFVKGSMASSNGLLMMNRPSTLRRSTPTPSLIQRFR